MPVVFQIAVISVNFFISIIIQRRASFAPIIDKHYSYCLTYNHNGYFLIKSPVFTPVFHIASIIERVSAIFFYSAFPSGKIILNTKKNITMETPPVIIVTSML